ncbi:MAG: RDD family protein [Myxococcales bacterium]|nr:RDD family protein [Myxococcales bacterium]
MNEDPDFNPYAPPSADTELVADQERFGDYIPATRGRRFLGNLIDSLLIGAAVIPGAVLSAGVRSPEGGALAMGVGALLVLAVQWYLISTSGQSIAKKMLGMRIIKMDGSPVNFVSGVILRQWVIMAAGFIPLLGNIIGLVDAAFIFREDYRCLHDHIAGTQVVMANPFSV